MYRSKSEVEKKLRQSKAIYKKLLNYKGKVFVRNGLDEESRTYPFLTDIGSFLSHSRSIFQYSHKEAKLRGKLSDYNAFLSKMPVISLFKELRDTEIHDSTLGKHTLIGLKGRLIRNNEESKSQEVTRDIAEEKQAKVTVSLSKKVEISPQLVQKLEKEGKKDLLAAIDKGEHLYEEVTLNGESDIFKLLEMYIDAITLVQNKF